MTDSHDPMTRMLIEWSCTHLVNRYNQLADAGRLEEAVDLFAPEGSYLTPAVVEPQQGRAAILAMLRGLPPMTVRHFVTNVVVDVLSPTEARGRSYLILLLSNELKADKAVAIGPAMTGEIDEHFVLTDKGWRFGHRQGFAGIRFAN